MTQPPSSRASTASSVAAEVVRRARERARQRVRWDRRTKAKHKGTAALLAYIERELFDPGLTVKRAREACRLRDNSVAIYFHRDVGEPPSAYVRGLRMAAAAEILRRTRLKVFQVGVEVGYPEPVTFTRAFSRLFGRSPTRYRQSVHRSRGSKSPPGRPAAVRPTVPSSPFGDHRRSV